ncbi:tyrosine-type recombinase/integrase [Psychrobacter sanguinis]|uniref:tyrosine-type recombinase/integrase n=1 Tax=Psychrobacter sanguinis TaxID=861445 RepID=UPI00191A6E02|nr:integrase arm-type DNA-binding domain-containing protein [Psychrobacter sanguinis]MCC3309174.1 tyrosine-type recombinase/integrase [Psychrobacter sanguinis]UEC26455.1 tyrosine-type recombinase/integrase [Psychrobacter sanguinis]
MLSDSKIRKLKPTDKCTPSRPDKYSDQQGLQLLVRSSGTRTWVSAYRFDGKQQKTTLGTYPQMSLAEARVANSDIKALVANGVNPKNKKRQDKLANEQAKMFNDYALEWLEERERNVKPRTYQQDYNRMHKDVLPSFKGIALKDVTFEDCKSMADNIESRAEKGTPPREVTRRTIDLAGNILKRAKRERLIEVNHTEGLKELYPKAKTKHMKHVELSELPKLLQDIEGYHGHEQTRLGMKFLAYSFCRTIELRMMKWEHIDFPNRLWRVDIDNLKIARKHVVPLSDQMLTILEEMRPITGQYEYVFYHTGMHQPYSEEFINNALDILGYAGRQTGHGFRHIASTNLNELGYMGDAIEKQMAHDKKSSIRAVYNHAQHLEERRKIMQVWADFLDLLRDKGEIVDFQTARQQIESSLNNYQYDGLEAIDKRDLIQALINKGMTKIELQKLLQ